MVGRRRKTLYGFTTQACLQYLWDLTFCFPEIFGGGSFRENFVGTGSEVLLLEM